MASYGGGREGFVKAVSDLYPGLIEKVRQSIESSEREYEGKRAGKDGGFLWEHTVHVASLAHDLAVSEGLDPVLPAVAALFHDAGKFRGGEYHKGDRPEEEDAAALAEAVLAEEGARASDIARVGSALRALYDEKARRNVLADVVHDADFLSKFGYLGVAGFFLKAALRGKNLVAAVTSSLSKELTYANALPRNMRTAAGRKSGAEKITGQPPILPHPARGAAGDQGNRLRDPQSDRGVAGSNGEARGDRRCPPRRARRL